MILLNVCALQVKAQKVVTFYGCKASIIYKSKDDFKIPYLQYCSVIAYPDEISKTRKANPSVYKQVDTEIHQIIISKNFMLFRAKAGTFEGRLKRLNQYLESGRDKFVKIYITNGVLVELEPVHAI